MLGTECKMAADVEAADYEETLENGIRRAQTLLDKLQFSEAQSVYQEVLRLAWDDTNTSAGGGGTCSRRPAAERASVAAISGLAESFARQSRTSYDDEQRGGSVPWLRLMIQVDSCVATSTKEVMFSPVSVCLSVTNC